MKKAVLFVFASVVAVIIIAIVFTLPAHRQIRAIHPPLPDFDAIAASLAGSQGPSTITFVNSAYQPGPFGNLGHPGVLIEWPDGSRFLIDTGMPPDEAIAFGKPMEYLLGAGPTATYGSLAEQLGTAVNSIKGIGFTHLHSDHTDGLPGICAAQAKPATVYQTPLQSGERNYTTDIGFKALEKARCTRQALAAAPIMSIPGFPGLVAVSLGGHTPGSTAFITRLGNNYWLFSGDITNNKDDLLHDRSKPWLYSTFVVPEDTQRTEQLRHYLLTLENIDGLTVLPAHDVDVMAMKLPTYPGR